MAKVFDFKYLYDISNVYTYLFYKLSDTAIDGMDTLFIRITIYPVAIRAERYNKLLICHFFQYLPCPSLIYMECIGNLSLIIDIYRRFLYISQIIAMYR